MKRIFKYNLDIKYAIVQDLSDIIDISMPAGANILTMQIDEKDGVPKIWALVDPNKEKIVRRFKIKTTGSEISEESLLSSKYIGTIQIEKGSFIGHIFEIFD